MRNVDRLAELEVKTSITREEKRWIVAYVKEQASIENEIRNRRLRGKKLLGWGNRPEEIEIILRWFLKEEERMRPRWEKEPNHYNNRIQFMTGEAQMFIDEPLSSHKIANVMRQFFEEALHTTQWHMARKWYDRKRYVHYMLNFEALKIIIDYYDVS